MIGVKTLIIRKAHSVNAYLMTILIGLLASHSPKLNAMVFEIIDPTKVNAKTNQQATETMKAHESIIDRTIHQLEMGSEKLASFVLKDKAAVSRVRAISNAKSDTTNKNLQSKYEPISEESVCSDLSTVWQGFSGDDGCEIYNYGEIHENNLISTLVETAEEKEERSIKKVDSVFEQIKLFETIESSDPTDMAMEATAQLNDVFYQAYGQASIPELTVSQKNLLDSHFTLMFDHDVVTIPKESTTDESRVTTTRLLRQYLLQTAIVDAAQHTYLPRTRGEVTKISQLSDIFDSGSSEHFAEQIINNSNERKTSENEVQKRALPEQLDRQKAIALARNLKRRTFILEQKLVTEYLAAFRTELLKEVLTDVQTK